MAIQSTAGTTLKVIVTAPATFDAAGYATLFAAGAFVGEITDLGEFGRDYNLITHNPIGTRITRKLKGSYNEGQMALKLGLDADDAGQIIMVAASKSDADYSFMITMQNLDKYYFQAKVMSWKVGAGSVDNIVSVSCNLEITSNSAGVGIIEAPAA
jgi:hypothetical protein